MITTEKTAGSFHLSDDGGHSFTITTAFELEGGWRARLELRSALMNDEEASIKHVATAAETFARLARDPLRTRTGRTHFTDVNILLGRGDDVGVTAWTRALEAIESAEKVMREARTAQTW